MRKLGSTPILISSIIVGLLSSAAGAEPLALAETDLDSIAAGGVNSPLTTSDSMMGGGEFTSQIAMPVSNAIALCYQCGDNANVIAIANAEAIASGTIDLQALADALRPYMTLPPSASPQPRPAKGNRGKR